MGAVEKVLRELDEKVERQQARISKLETVLRLTRAHVPSCYSLGGGMTCRERSPDNHAGWCLTCLLDAKIDAVLADESRGDAPDPIVEVVDGQLIIRGAAAVVVRGGSRGDEGE